MSIELDDLYCGFSLGDNFCIHLITDSTTHNSCTVSFICMLHIMSVWICGRERERERECVGFFGEGESKLRIFISLNFYFVLQEYNFLYKPGNVSTPPPIVGQLLSSFSFLLKFLPSLFQAGISGILFLISVFTYLSSLSPSRSLSLPHLFLSDSCSVCSQRPTNLVLIGRCGSLH